MGIAIQCRAGQYHEKEQGDVWQVHEPMMANHAVVHLLMQLAGIFQDCCVKIVSAHRVFVVQPLPTFPPE